MKKFILYLLLTIHIPLAFGQNQAQQGNDWQDKLFTAPEYVLPILMDAAILHSAEIEKLDAEKQVAHEDIRLEKKNILSGFSMVSGYNYGTLPFFATSEQRINQINAFALNAQAQYNVGVNMNIPLDVLLSRRRAVHKQELILKQAEADRKIEEKEIRQKVIELYQELALAKVTLQHYLDARQSAEINKKISDRRFKDGEIQVDEQMAAIDFYNKAVLAQEQAKNKYQTAVLLMEEMIGMPLSDLMKSK